MQTSFHHYSKTNIRSRIYNKLIKKIKIAEDLKKIHQKYLGSGYE